MRRYCGGATFVDTLHPEMSDIFLNEIFTTEDDNLNALDDNNEMQVSLKDSDIYYVNDDQVKLQVYYECLCPGSRDFYSNDLRTAIKKLNHYVSMLDIYTYPYGHAKTSEVNGNLTFECQHGPEECYGNKLHACAIDQLKNISSAIMYNGCLMDTSREAGSDDATADTCGEQLGIDSEPIKQCAKDDHGSQLLDYYGKQTKKAHLQYVPYVLINGEELQNDIWKELCAAFVNPPPPCKKSF